MAPAMKKKFDLALQAKYDEHRDRIVLVADKATHPALSDAGFHVALKTGTESEAALREQLEAAGVIPAQPEVAQAPSLRELYTPQDAALLELLVDSGRSIAVVGPDASGKSTLLDAMVQRVLNVKPLGRTVLMHEVHAFEAMAGPRVRILETPKGVAFTNAGYSVVVKDEFDNRWVLTEGTRSGLPLTSPEAHSAQLMIQEGTVLYAAVNSMDLSRAHFLALDEVGFDVVILLQRAADADEFTYPNVSLRFYVEGHQVRQ
jgi:hypothetical protein